MIEHFANLEYIHIDAIVVWSVVYDRVRRSHTRAEDRQLQLGRETWQVNESFRWLG
jgi:hypothetical protein